MVSLMESQWPGCRIMNTRSADLEEALERTWARTVRASKEEVCGNTGHTFKMTSEGHEVLMGQATEFRKTSLRQHLRKHAAQSTRDHLFWEFLYGGFVEARAWCTKGPKGARL